MRIGIPKEVLNGERRVAATPDTVKKMIKMGFEVSVEAGAGGLANYPDQMFIDAGASITSDADSLWSSSDLICKINPPQARSDGSHEADLLADRGTLISLLFPEQNPELVERLQLGSKTAIALDKIPRITRAQKMDVLSSMANIAGYRSVLEAAHLYGGFFGGQITAAGKTRPAQVLVIGAGVAGLAAIGTARGLGAEVRAFDVRPACKEQVESMGARFLMLDVPMDESQESSGGYANIMSDQFLQAELAVEQMLNRRQRERLRGQPSSLQRKGWSWSGSYVIRPVHCAIWPRWRYVLLKYFTARIRVLGVSALGLRSPGCWPQRHGESARYPFSSNVALPLP